MRAEYVKGSGLNGVVQRRRNAADLAVEGDAEAAGAGFDREAGDEELLEFRCCVGFAEERGGEEPKHRGTGGVGQEVEREVAGVETLAAADVSSFEDVAVVSDEEQRRLASALPAVELEVDFEAAKAQKGASGGFMRSRSSTMAG